MTATELQTVDTLAADKLELLLFLHCQHLVVGQRANAARLLACHLQYPEQGCEVHRHGFSFSWGRAGVSPSLAAAHQGLL